MLVLAQREMPSNLVVTYATMTIKAILILILINEVSEGFAWCRITDTSAQSGGCPGELAE